MTGRVVLNDFVLVDGPGAAPVPGARVVLDEGVIASVDSSVGGA